LYFVVNQQSNCTIERITMFSFCLPQIVKMSDRDVKKVSSVDVLEASDKKLNGHIEEDESEKEKKKENGEEKLVKS